VALIMLRIQTAEGRRSVSQSYSCRVLLVLCMVVELVWSPPRLLALDLFDSRTRAAPTLVQSGQRTQLPSLAEVAKSAMPTKSLP
jgi:hypothetical protein